MPRSRHLAADLPGVTQLVRRKPKPEPASSSWLRSIVISLIKREHPWALAFSLYLPLFFFNVAWFLPLALLPRGVLSELLARRWLGPRS